MHIANGVLIIGLTEAINVMGLVFIIALCIGLWLGAECAYRRITGRWRRWMARH